MFEFRERLRNDVACTSLSHLLEILGRPDLWSLEALIDDETDGKVDFVEVDTAGVTLGSEGWATTLEFPFFIAEFWDQLAWCEDRVRRDWEMAEEAQVREMRPYIGMCSGGVHANDDPLVAFMSEDELDDWRG